MARVKKSEPKAYGELKKSYQFALTPTTDEVIQQASEELGISRSELVEQIFRSGAVEIFKGKESLKKL